MMKRTKVYLKMAAVYVLIGMLMFITMLSGALDKLWAWCLKHRQEFAFYSTIGLLSFLLFTCSYKRGYEAAERQIQAFSDTVIVTHVEYDTIVMEKPVPVAVTKYKTIHDTLLIHDTQEPVVVDIPIDQWHFKQDSLYDLWLEGAYVNVDSIAVYPKTIYHDRTITKTKDYSRWALGASIGYAVTPVGASPYIGLSLNYDLIRFKKTR